MAAAGPDLYPRGDRGQRVLVERDRARASALAVADRDPPASGALDRLAQRRVAGAPALVDVADQDGGGLGAAQPGGAEQVQQGEVAPALASAAVGHAQQPLPLVVIERARLAAPRRGPSGRCGAPGRRRPARRRGRAARRDAWPRWPANGRRARARRGRRGRPRASRPLGWRRGRGRRRSFGRRRRRCGGSPASVGGRLGFVEPTVLEVAQHARPALRALAVAVLDGEQSLTPSSRTPITTSRQSRSSSPIRTETWTPSTNR